MAAYIKPSSVPLVKNTGFDPESLKKKILATRDFDEEDIVKCTYLFLSRGTNITKMKERTSPDGVKEIDKLVRKYGIQSSVKNSGPEAVNLARIASCFPVTIIANLQRFNEDSMPRPVRLSEFAAWSNIGFPRVFCCSAVASLLPSVTTNKLHLTEENIDTCLKLITCYSALESKVINKSMSGKSLAELYKVSMPYVTAAHRSKIVTNEDRFKIIEDGGFEPVISTSGVMDPKMNQLLDDIIKSENLLN